MQSNLFSSSMVSEMSPKEAHNLRSSTNWLSHSKTALDYKDSNLSVIPILKGL